MRIPLVLALVMVVAGEAHAQDAPELMTSLRAEAAGGGRVATDIDAVRTTAEAALSRCERLASRLGERAEARLRVSVDANGRITTASVLVEGDVDAPTRRWHRCVTAAITRLRFAAGEVGTLEVVVSTGPPSALGAMSGEGIGESFGVGGLGLRGDGSGGGTGTVGGGRVASRVRSGAAEVEGSLDRAIIQRVVRRHIDEVRFCYEQALTRTPGLAGRIDLRFAITTTGAVGEASVEADTIRDPAVAACLVSAVRRWTFPAPEGGAVVVVRYPFVFAPERATE